MSKGTKLLLFWSGKVHSALCQSLNPLRHQIPSQRVIGDREQCRTMEDDDQKRGTSRFLTLPAKKAALLVSLQKLHNHENCCKQYLVFNEHPPLCPNLAMTKDKQTAHVDKQLCKTQLQVPRVCKLKDVEMSEFVRIGK